MSYKTRIKAIVCFGDIRGFSTWELGLTAPDLEFPPFMNRFDNMVREFHHHSGYHTKTLADGFMTVLELSNCSEHTIFKFLYELWAFGQTLNLMIKHHPWPRPDGFRIRAASGHVWKKVLNGEVDYVGRHANTAHKLLGVRPEIPFLCHQSVMELVSPSFIEKRQMQFREIEGERRIPDGLIKSDMSHLHAFEKRKKGK